MWYKNARELLKHSASTRKIFLNQAPLLQDKIYENEEFIHTAEQMHHFIDKMKVQIKQEKIATILF